MIALAASGCAGASLSSVQATAALGQKLGAFEGALDETPLYCGKIMRLTGGSPGTCGVLDPRWRRAPTLLSAYAGALARLAGHDDVEVQDQVSAVLSAGAAGSLPGGPNLSSDEQGIVALAADAIVSSVSAAWREEKLKQVIVDYNGYVGGTVKNLSALVDANLEKLALLDSAAAGFARQVEVNLGDQPNAPTEGAAIRRLQRLLSLAYVDDLTLWVRAERSRLIHYKRALGSFGAAHQALFEHAGDFAENDLAILQTILADVVAEVKLNPDGN